ncbi:MAG: response regulator [Acidobacteriia bacterium]|nr:response regulator [Terriglobia bacterium]
MKTRGVATLRDTWFDNTAMQSPTLLIVGPVEDDRTPDSVFGQLPWQAHRVPNCFELALQLHSSVTRVIVCERDLPDGSWKDVLKIAGGLTNPPPVIVTSRLADDYLWAEVLNLGGYDVLAKPLDNREVRRTVSLAWDHWANQQSSARRSWGAYVGEGGPRACLTA